MSCGFFCEVFMKRKNFMTRGFAVKTVSVLAALTVLTAFDSCASTKTGKSKAQPDADSVLSHIMTADTHLHVDVPLRTEDMPGADIDLAVAMKKAGIDAVVMTFAVDYVPLTEKGQAYQRFLNGLSGQKAMLKYSGIELSLNADDVRRHVQNGEPVVIQSVEGGHFLEGDISRLQEAYDAGLRIFTLLHDNDANPPLGDVYTNEPAFGGLTELGAAAIRESERLGILVDLAHADDNTVRMALNVATKPVLISHTGLNTQLGNDEFMAQMMYKRLINAETARLVASKGGVIGVWPHLASTPEEYAANIKALVDVVGIDHVTIGTDSKITPEYKEFNPEMIERIKKEMGDAMPNDGREKREPPKQNLDEKNHVWSEESDSFYHSVVRCLLAEGFSEEDIAKIAGENFMRVFEIATK